MGINRQLIAHGAGRHEQGRRLAKALGRHLLQRNNRRIISIHIITKHCMLHGFPHGGGRLGHGITAYVNPLHVIPFYIAQRRS